MHDWISLHRGSCSTLLRAASTDDMPAAPPLLAAAAAAGLGSASLTRLPGPPTNGGGGGGGARPLAADRAGTLGAVADAPVSVGTMMTMAFVLNSSC